MCTNNDYHWESEGTKANIRASGSLSKSMMHKKMDDNWENNSKDVILQYLVSLWRWTSHRGHL